jgi:hypothetical protein
MPSYTPNYNLERPTVGSDLDVWGGKLNTNFSKIDTAMKGLADSNATTQTGVTNLAAASMLLDGSQAMTGPMTLVAGNPTNARHATSKDYVDTALTTSLAPKAPIASPAFTGTPTAPTPATGDSSTNIATTAFVTTAVNNALEQVWKTADQTASLNSVTFQADNTLFFTMAAGKQYWFKAYLLVSGTATQGVKIGIAATQTPQAGRVASSGFANLSSITTTAVSTWSTTAATAYSLIQIRGFVTANATTGGDLKLYFAQAAASATAGTAPIMRAGSVLEYGPLG